MRLAVLLLLFPALAFSQSKIEAPVDSTPAADPARPTVTNPAHIPPPGYLQYEQGFVQANDSPNLQRQFSIVQTTKLSLIHHFMLQVQSQPIAHSVLPPATNDTGDLILGAQVLFTDREEGHSRTPTLALAYNRRVRTGTSPDLDIGSYSQGLTFLGSGTNYGIHYDANVVFNEQQSINLAGNAIHRAQFGQSLALTRQLTKNASFSGELWHFTQPFLSASRNNFPVDRANAVGLLFAAGYTLRPNLVLDAGFDHGLTSTSTNWQGFAGFTYLLPHRLFPARKH